MNEEKKPLIVIAGPTAVGKTESSIRIAKAINGEIISADSMQVYKYMDIGTAKIKKDEMEGICHHLIDILEPTQEFNICMFKELANMAIKEIYSKGKIPIIVGGTGFYIQSVLKDIDFTKEEENNSVREELYEFARINGNEALYERLRQVDPASCEKIHCNNVKRVIRALEYNILTKKLMSEHNEEEFQKESPYDYMYFVINNDRDILYERIEKRIELMIDAGLTDEVKLLLSLGVKPDMTSFAGIGYKELIPYIEGKASLSECVEVLKKETRHFAKRQITWFKREKDVIWMNYQDYDQDKEKLIDKMIDMIGEHYGIK